MNDNPSDEYLFLVAFMNHRLDFHSRYTGYVWGTRSDNGEQGWLQFIAKYDKRGVVIVDDELRKHLRAIYDKQQLD